MSTNITDRAAQVLAEIDDATAEALAWENLAWEKSLRCLKTAIEALLDIIRANGNATYMRHAERKLTTLCYQWEAAK